MLSRTISAGVVLAALALLPARSFASTPTPVTPTPTATPQPAKVSVTTLAARQVLAAMNKSRAAHHVAPLGLDARESKCSLKHSQHMARLQTISHDQFPSDVCVPFSTAGENVGVAPGDAIAAALLIERIMYAEGPCPHKGCPRNEYHAHGHYLNIINPAFKNVGIGIYVKSGNVWLTEDFTG